MRPILGTSLLLLGLAGGYYGLLGRGHLREIEALQQQIESSYAGADSTELQFSRVEPLRHTAQQLENLSRTLGEHLTVDDVSTPPLLQVSALLQAAGLAIARSEVLVDAPVDELSSAKLHIVVSGAFTDLFCALETIENARPPMRIVSLGIQAGSMSGKVNADLVMVRVWRIER